MVRHKTVYIDDLLNHREHRIIAYALRHLWLTMVEPNPCIINEPGAPQVTLSEVEELASDLGMPVR